MTPLISKLTLHGPFRVPAADGVGALLSVPAAVIFRGMLAAAPMFAGALQEAVKEGRFRLSDALPQENERLYLPLPATLPMADGFCRSSQWLIKEAEMPIVCRLRYLREKSLVVAEAGADAGLYLIIECERSLQPIVEEALFLLGLSGFGACRSLGWGQFSSSPLCSLSALDSADAKALLLGLQGQAGPYLSLSATLPPAEELSFLGEVAFRLWPQRHKGPLLAAGSVFSRPFKGGNQDLPQPIFWEVPKWSE